MKKTFNNMEIKKAKKNGKKIEITNEEKRIIKKIPNELRNEKEWVIKKQNK